MPLRSSLLALSIALLAAGGTSAAAPLPAPGSVRVPLGYHLDSADVVTPRPSRLEAQDGDFTFSVSREFSDSTTERLLSIAESCYPSRDLLIDLAVSRYLEMGSDTSTGALWWCDGPGVRRVAYAVTARAMEHYLGLCERFRDHDYLVEGGRGLWWTELKYHALIEARTEFVAEGKEYRNVYVAYLSLAWGYDDGVTVPTFQAHRIVVLEPTGDVLAVLGDGSAVEDFHLTPHRAVGRRDWIGR